MNILLVDDEKVQIETLRRGLKSRGHSVLEALNAAEAMDVLERESENIDMVITDYIMAEKDGIELLKSIRETYGSMPVIMMTAYGEKRVIVDALRNRCDGFIEKPFTLDELMEEIGRAQATVLTDSGSDRFLKIIPRIVHQVNNPLNSIMASAYLAVNKPDDPDALKRYMDNIVSCISDIKEINQKLSSLGKGAVLDKKPIDLRMLLEKSLARFDELITLKNVGLQKQGFKGAEKIVMGSEFDLEQVFKNLILNAIDAMDGCDKKLLSVSIEDDGSSMFVKISDTGRGIDPDAAKNLFESYFTTKAQGTGLGLCVARQIARRHGGDISFNSDAGNGAEFAVELPS